MPLKTVLCSRQSRKFAGDGVFFGKPRWVAFSQTRTSWSGFLNGSGRSRIALTTLKMAVFAPMPSASASTAMAVNAGLFVSIRRP